MTINSYATLVAAIPDFLLRSDLTAIVPTWVGLAEADINRRLRHPSMVTRLENQSLSAEYVDLPSDYLEVAQVTYDGDLNRKLTQVSTDYMDRFTDDSGQPRWYSIVGTQLRFYPITTGGTYDLTYYQRIPALSDSNTTNWLLDVAPDVYLYGSLIHSAPYLQEDARVGTWRQLYADAVLSLEQTGMHAGWSAGGSLRG